MKTIVITSNEPWGDIWFSKQHYANELSKLGYSVIFINPPRPWRVSNLFEAGPKLQQIRPGITICNVQNAIPQRILPMMALKINDWINCQKLKKILRDKKVIFWHFDPFRFVFIKAIQCARIYHVVDPYFHIPTDAILTEKANIIPVVSPYYLTRYPKDKTLLIPHGLSVEERLLDAKVLEGIRPIVGEGFVLFMGTINPDVDLDLLLKLGQANVPLLLISNNSDHPEFQKLIAFDNVQHIGTQPAEQLKYYVHLAKVCIIPYKEKMTGNIHRTPLKLVHYLAQAKPVVTTINYEIDQLEGTWIHTRKKSAFIDTMLKLLKANESQVDEKLEEYLADIRYSKLISEILGRLNPDL